MNLFENRTKKFRILKIDKTLLMQFFKKIISKLIQVVFKPSQHSPFKILQVEYEVFLTLSHCTYCAALI